jgi:hypothetical protein
MEIACPIFLSSVASVAGMLCSRKMSIDIYKSNTDTTIPLHKPLYFLLST